MPDDSEIATHQNPANRARSNYIVRLNLAADGMPGRYEQVWTRTDDGVLHEICCIPFFPYGLSLGDVISLIGDDGDYRIERKSGHRTIRIAFKDEEAAHRLHDDVHGALVASGVVAEFRGPHGGYGAIDLADDGHVQAVIHLLEPASTTGDLEWEWADQD